MEFEHGAEETVQKVFGDEKDFYEILGLKKTATQKEIKRAYRKMALKYVRRRFFVFRLYDSIFFLSIKNPMLFTPSIGFSISSNKQLTDPPIQHPDKNKDPNASKQFQALGIVHETLHTPERRKIYDETGQVTCGDLESLGKWMDYWRKLFPKITTNDIDEFTLKYRFSDDERADVIKAYVSYKGDMKKVVNSIMCSNEDDLERFASMIDSEIQNGKIETFPKYKSFVNKKKKTKRTKKKKKENSMDALRAAILQRQKNTQALAKSNKKTKRHREFDLLTDKLAEKYVKKKKKEIEEAGKRPTL